MQFKKIYTLTALLFLCIVAGCKQEVAPAEDLSENDVKKDRFRENFRPQYHFTPPEKWMNDPNGLLYHKGTYHLFYQYYPEDIVWGPMHWGHATSKDLISWEHQPIALYPDDLGMIFSGSAVMDTQNTSGLGTEDNPPMVAIFTYHFMEGEKAGRKDFQTQGIAYSLDEGKTWEKYEGNPVIGNGGNIKDFRDPKVMWYEPSQEWIMTLVAGDHAKFYSSSNLKDWTLVSEFGRDKGAHGGVWECPDLFPLAVENSEEKKWVLLISINPGAPNGGSGTQYFVGDFDGKRFTTDQQDTKWLDYGTDNYAGVTYNGLPDDERTFIGWMSNWNYARNTPTEVWRSAMTLPRKLSLHQNDQGYYLKNFPVSTIREYVETPLFSASGKGNLFEGEFNQHRMDFKINGPLENFNVLFSNEQGDELQVGYHKEDQMFYVDRVGSGLTDFHETFANRIHMAPAIEDTEQSHTFSLFIDTSSIEFFVNGGATVLTEQIFPNEPYTEILFEGAATYQNITISQVKSIWD